MTLTILCPIDRLALRVVTPVEKQGDATNLRGEHVHNEIDSSGTCPNGHTWTIQADMLLTRTA